MRRKAITRSYFSVFFYFFYLEDSDKIRIEYDEKIESIRKEYDKKIEKENDWQKRNNLQNEMNDKIGREEKEKQEKIDKLITDKDDNRIDDEIDEWRKLQKLLTFEQYPDANEIDDDYREKNRDQELAMQKEAINALDNVQWAMWLKFLLDLAKVFGSILVILAALHIAADAQANTTLKVYAMICATIILFTYLCFGLFTYIN